MTAAATVRQSAFPIRAIALFALAAIAVTTIAGLVLSRFYTTPLERQAIIASAVIALALQLLAFAIVRLVGRDHIIAAWGIGTLMRFAMLAIYGFLLAPAFGLPAAAALVSFAVFLFASTLLEPLFLKP